MQRHSLTVLTGLIFLTGLAASCGGSADTAEDAAADAAVPAETAATEQASALESLRVTTERFADVNAALTAGYIPDPSGMCITAAMEGQPAENGNMGIHYLRPDLLGLMPPAGRVNGTGMHMDFNDPGVLLYEPQADGSMRLVGIENLVWAQPWQAAGNAGAPEFMGEEYVYMIDDPATEADEAHGFEPHYELHVWIHQENPRGVFAPFNPAVTCDHATPAPAAGAP
jgi:hypothetical protein